MNTQSIHYSRPMIPMFFEGVSHSDLKWTINYLMGLLEIPEKEVKEEPLTEKVQGYSARINKLLSIPKISVKQSDIDNDALMGSGRWTIYDTGGEDNR